MTTYMSAEENNQIIKTMMLQNTCNHISGDDTNDNGFRLMIKEDDECECNVVRSFQAGDGLSIRVDQNNSLIIHKSDQPISSIISGGGVITLSHFRNNFLAVNFRLDGSISFRPSAVQKQSLCQCAHEHKYASMVMVIL